MVIFKILGALSVLFGVFLIFGFPGRQEEQWFAMSRTAIVLGIFFILLGIYLFTL